MRRVVAVPVVIVLLAVAAGWVVSSARPGRSEGIPPGARTHVDLTVYPHDFAMVSEVRPLSLEAGHNRVAVTDVSRALDPQSVILGFSGGAGAPRLTAHAYDLGVSTRAGLLRRYLGQEVEIVRYGENGREADRQAGTLMAADEGNLVIRSDGRFFVDPPGTIVARARPAVVTIPQLSVEADSPSAQNASLRVGYLTRGLSWSADYVATLPPGSDALDLECWATVTNRSGVDFPAARVTLVAGDPNRAVQNAASSPPGSIVERDAEAKRGVYAGARARSEAPVALGDAQAFRVDSPTTIVQEQMNRVLLFAASNVPARRDYSARAPALAAWDYWYGWGTPARPRRGPVAVSLSFVNRKDNHLGMPLPSGALRIYEPDQSGVPRYVGAAAIADTPAGARVGVTLASAFDVTTEYVVARKKRLDRRTLRKDVEVTVRNGKAGPVVVRVVQPFYGTWRVLSESAPHTRIDARQAQWAVPVPAGGTVKLTYAVTLSE